MSWSAEQRASIAEQYWSRGEAVCPKDDTRLDINDTRRDSAGYILLLRCPRCGETDQMNWAQDPRHDAFREWTPEEKQGLVDGHFASRRLACPVCDTKIAPQTQPLSGVHYIHFACPRCGAVHGHKHELGRD